MADGDTTTTTTSTTTTAPPWHDGVDAALIGWAQNKGFKLDSPKDAFSAAVKQAFEAEKHFSAPPDRLIRLPEKPDDAAWNGVFTKLGVPAEAKDYDLSNIKFAGNDLEQSFADTMRAALHKGRVPKDAAPEVVKAVVGYLEQAEAQETTITNAKLAEEKAKLTKDWGPNYDFNHLKAMEGARKLGITPDAVKALEGQIGFAAVMEAMRKIGQGTSEDAFVEGNRGPGGNPTTRDGAISRKQELMADKDWARRYLAGGVKERQEMDGLNIMIDGEAA